WGMVVTRVVHRGARNESYRNTFRGIPANRAYRMVIDPSRWPRIHGTLPFTTDCEVWRTKSSFTEEIAAAPEPADWEGISNAAAAPANDTAAAAKVAGQTAGEKQSGAAAPMTAGAAVASDLPGSADRKDKSPSLDGPMQWVWEASAPVPGPQPFTIMAGTEQFAKAGITCPRSGRWIARFRTHDWKYHHDLSQIVTVAQGKPMPAIRDGADADWEWLGV
ncbi:MAG TPA: hypothetical protein VL689_14655, partial [Paraburkholderia sp.]|nr:hypothetical protein [Paraburkholderia sp.]